MEVKVINPKNLKFWLENNEAVLVDVREPEENKAARIHGSRLIPLAIIDAGKLSDIKNKKIVIHCRSGKRSENACRKLLNENPNLEVYNLEGGIESWRAAGYDTASGAENFTSSGRSKIENQTQIIAGLVIFFGIVLGKILSPVFFILPLFLGVGLIFAGFGKWYPFLKFLNKMPWNKNQNSK